MPWMMAGFSAGGYILVCIPARLSEQRNKPAFWTDALISMLQSERMVISNIKLRLHGLVCLLDAGAI
jgi:hypothetical protein